MANQNETGQIARGNMSYAEYNRLRRLMEKEAKLKEKQDEQAHKRALELAQAKTAPGMTIENAIKLRGQDQTSSIAKKQFGLNEKKVAADQMQQWFDSQDKLNQRSATSIDKTTGEEVFDSAKYTKASEKLNVVYGKYMARQRNQQSQYTPEQEKAIRERVNTSKTNKWGDDLTKDAPTATTTYKDGKRTFSYPGTTDPKTGQVRGSMSITSPYGSEEEYNNRQVVRGQNPDGSWNWVDRKPGEPASGGGFFQRDGLSDLGRALAGDAPRRTSMPYQAPDFKLSSNHFGGGRTPLESGIPARPAKEPRLYNIPDRQPGGLAPEIVAPETMNTPKTISRATFSNVVPEEQRVSDTTGEPGYKIVTRALAKIPDHGATARRKKRDTMAFGGGRTPLPPREQNVSIRKPPLNRFRIALDALDQKYAIPLYKPSSRRQ